MKAAVRYLGTDHTLLDYSGQVVLVPRADAADAIRSAREKLRPCTELEHGSIWEVMLEDFPTRIVRVARNTCYTYTDLKNG